MFGAARLPELGGIGGAQSEGFALRLDTVAFDQSARRAAARNSSSASSGSAWIAWLMPSSSSRIASTAEQTSFFSNSNDIA